MMKSVKDEVSALRASSASELAAAKRKLKVDIAVLQTDVDNLTEESRETKTGLASLRTEVDHLKGTVPAVPAPRSSVQPPRSVNRETQSKGNQVFVQGFYDISTGAGEIAEDAADKLSEQLLANVPSALQAKFKLDKRFKTFRRLSYVFEEGGDACWDLRHKLVDVIETNNITLNGKPLKVRVQGSQDMEDRRAHFWRNVYALKQYAEEDKDFFVAPQTHSIHEATNMDIIGSASPEGFTWNESVMSSAMPSVKLVEVKKASLMRNRRKH